MVKLNRIIFGFYLFFLILSLLFVIDSSVVDSFRDYGNQWTLFIRQFTWIIISIIVYIFISHYPISKLFNLTSKLYWTNIFLLFLVLLPGIGAKVNGARRWFDLGFMHLQPSEFIKFTLLLYLATQTSSRNFRIAHLLPIFVPVLLILFQPDFSTAAIIFGTGLISLFIIGFPIKKIIAFLPIGLIVIMVYVILSPYRLERVKGYLSLHRGDNQTEIYQTRQSLIAIGRGGLFGVGLGESRQKYNFLPESSTDAIFSILAEETGFFGSTLLLLLYVMLIASIFKLSMLQKTPANMFFSSGVAVYVSLQTFLNLGSLVGLLPVTGVPLPFISYGGSSLLNFSLLLGVLSQISKSYEA